MKERWQLNRAGLFNFWYYDEEEFQFANGKLLLRGSNGSGKSVTMQSLITVLLDGKKSPDRLDPFGSKARRMEDYLLGEKEVQELDERTGYLYLEYIRPGTGQYFTTGMGLKAKRHSPLDSWGFVVWDNRRIGDGLLLYKTERDLAGNLQKIPLTRRELEHRLETGGKVVKTQKEYMELVNKYLFGFASTEAFEELMKLLIQLRSPKLSKDFRPTVIYEILNESLPALSDEELRPLSDTIENMDQIKSQLDQLVREEQALGRLCKHYDQYNRKVLEDIAQGLVRAYSRQEQGQRKLGELEQQLTEGTKRLVELEEGLQGLRQEQEVLAGEETELKQHDVFRAEKDKAELLHQLKQAQVELDRKQHGLTEKQQRENQTKKQINELERLQSRHAEVITGHLDEMDLLAQEAAFLNHDVAADEFNLELGRPFSFSLWRKEVRDYEDQLNKVVTAFSREARTKENYQDAERELGEARQHWDQAQLEEKKCNEAWDAERENWLADVFVWRQGNKEMHLSEADVTSIAQRLPLCPEEVSWEELREPVRAAHEGLRGLIQQEVAGIEHSIKQQEVKIQLTEAELDEWRKQKEPEPPRQPAVEEARQALAERGIPFVPFYAAVEFHAGIAPEERERIEAALTEAGILDALITPGACQRLANDRILKARPQILNHTLADYLYPVQVEGIAADEIDRILRSILVGNDEAVEEGDTCVGLDGVYRIGLLHGHAPRTAASIYIGKESRRRYRLQQMELLEAQLAAERLELARIKEQKAGLMARMDLLAEEYGRFPADSSMRDMYQKVESARGQVKLREQEVERKNHKYRQTLEAWQQAKTMVRELARTIPLELSQPVYGAAVQKMRQYSEELQSLEVEHQKWQNCYQQLEILAGNLAETVDAVDELKGELAVLRDNTQLLTAKLARLEERLRELGAEEIRRKIEMVVQRLQELPDAITKQVQAIERLRSEKEQKGLELNDRKIEQQLAQGLLQQWLQLFEQEGRLQQGFALHPGDNAVITGTHEPAEGQASYASHRQREQEELSAASQVRRAKQLLTGSGRGSAPDLEALRMRLNETYLKEMAYLVEYRLAQITTGAANFEDLPLPGFQGEAMEQTIPEEVLEHWRIQWEELKRKSSRLQIVLEYEGKRVNPYYVQSQLQKATSLQQQLLNEKDRELYEEIILNSVGRVIRERINRAQRWVGDMNKLMDERDTSSGLTFSIVWRPRTAEREDELDTGDLVELLKSDARLLKESDMARITTHFRAKIEQAKKLLEDKGFGESLHQIIREMLDYRQWFAFTLYYRKEREKRKELTNNVFYTFSGGEKAMAMYIPLFSAAYSRYSEAKPDAPPIICLDEAFAGVDENNIRDMFDLVEKLGFNYIMNSQALWGDYDTVSSLAIYELVRPKNAPYVSVIRYRWDGKVRQLMLPEEEYALEAAGT